MIKHDVKCKKFPDPFDERDPVGPCTCGVEDRPSNPRLAILRDDMLADDCETPIKVYMEASRWAADEIERLHSLADKAEHEWQEDVDEIERLTAELAAERDEVALKRAALQGVQAERDRLRAALRTIADETCEYGAGLAKDCGECRSCIAEKALAGAPDETSVGHTCHNGATIYLSPGEKCRWCDAANGTAPL